NFNPLSAEFVNQDNVLEAIDEAEKNELIEINRPLIMGLAGGLLIADEIHNTYNQKQENKYGLAIRYVLNYLENIDPPKVLLLSATPIGGEASEIVDLLNILLPVNFKRTDFLKINKNGISKLLPNALDEIMKLTT